MSVLKYYDETSSTWIAVAKGEKGEKGDTGGIGPEGPQGVPGATPTLPSLGITSTAAELNYTDGVTSNIQTQLSTKAPLASPALTGTPTAPTAAAGTSTTQVATTAFVENSAPFIISATAPTNTSKLWIDNSGIAYFYNGTAWVSIKGTYAD